MSKWEKIKSVIAIIWHLLWLTFAGFIWFFGFWHFREEKTFEIWAVWGASLSFFIIGTIIRLAITQGRQGAEDGANSYTVSFSGDRATVTNHTIGGAIFGFILGLVAGVLAGPIIVPFMALKAIGSIFNNIARLIRGA